MAEALSHDTHHRTDTSAHQKAFAWPRSTECEPVKAHYNFLLSVTDIASAGISARAQVTHGCDRAGRGVARTDLGFLRCHAITNDEWNILQWKHIDHYLKTVRLLTNSDRARQLAAGGAHAAFAALSGCSDRYGSRLYSLYSFADSHRRPFSLCCWFCRSGCAHAGTALRA